MTHKEGKIIKKLKKLIERAEKNIFVDFLIVIEVFLFFCIIGLLFLMYPWKMLPLVILLGLFLIGMSAEPDKKLKSKNLYRNRNIPEKVRREVWRRDQASCVRCGSKTDLELDHIIPFSKGGSNSARNIQLLCRRCNRKKSDKI